MELVETALEGCYELRPAVHRDGRGTFVKVFQESAFRALRLETSFREDFFSVSRKGVLRGLHFQVPPAAQQKAVFCLFGEVLDAVLDLRDGSPTYGRHALFRLSGDEGNGVYIPRGMAHGFLALSDEALVLYKASEEHSPARDAGVLWNSCGIPWPVEKPIISERDAAFPALKDFRTPFGLGTGGRG